AWRDGQGVVVRDAPLARRSPAASPPSDSDKDGIPDSWEKTHGRSPGVADGHEVVNIAGCAAGYSALECYINELADSLVPAK
ncbi:MAG: hypothetical protein RJA70_3423, partial [Pseudomonadota bacterium]